MITRKLGMPLAIALIMFPQIVETIYSPALTDIAISFNVNAENAAQTLSIYFFAFAVGVLFWGRMCDIIGRRYSIIAGLVLYAIASFFALIISEFTYLLLARMAAAFGAAVGSVGIQTMMRDSFNGNELTRVYSVIGIAIAGSPAIGVLSGALLTFYWGYRGVFWGLAFLAIILLIYSLIYLPETRPATRTKVSLINILNKMLKDPYIWYISILVALFNISMFSYYQLAPFIFEKLEISVELFGYTGIILGLGVGLGSWINKKLLQKGTSTFVLILYASIIACIGALFVTLLVNRIWFIVPMIGMVIGYGIAIPCLLSNALVNYKHCLGTAGAILGMWYYLMIAIGLVLSGLSQQLGLVLLSCSSVAILLSYYLINMKKVNIQVEVN